MSQSVKNLKMDEESDLYVFAFDVEASARNIKEGFMPCFGCSVQNAHTGEEVDSFKAYIAQPEDKIWGEDCVEGHWSKHPEMFQDTKNRVALAKDKKEVMEEFMKWALEIGKKYKNTIIVSDTAGYDVAWMDSYLPYRNSLYLLGDYNPTRDITSYMLGVLNEPINAWNVNAKFEEKYNVKFPKFKYEKDHDPHHDAYVIAATIIFVMQTIGAVKKRI